MEIILPLAGLGFIFLVAVVLFRTMRLTSEQTGIDPVDSIALDGQEMANRLAQAIRFQTVSHQDPSAFDGAEFARLHAYLQQNFPRVHERLDRETVADYSLLYTWKGEDEEAKPILLMGHIDVVPAESEAGSGWTHPPFSGAIADGYIWGRGTLDNKDAVLGTLEAVELLLRQGFQPRRTIYLAFGHDEEIGGCNGATQIAALLHSRGVELEYVLDEGLAILEGILTIVPKPIALVGIAEKGYASIEMSVESEGGHSMMPPRQTTIGILASAIHKLERNQLPARMTSPIRQLFNALAPEMSLVPKMMFANLWLFEGLVKRQLAATATTNAMIRTTTAPTMFEAGVKENILPAKGRAVVNYRILPGESIDSLVEHVRHTIDDPQVTIGLLGGFRSEPSMVSDTQSPSFRAVARTIHQVFPEAILAPGLVLGGTDSRHYASLTSSIFRFSPMWMHPGDPERIHGVNERISISGYEQVVRFYIQLIRNSTEE